MSCNRQGQIVVAIVVSVCCDFVVAGVKCCRFLVEFIKSFYFVI